PSPLSLPDALPICGEFAVNPRLKTPHPGTNLFREWDGPISAEPRLFGVVIEIRQRGDLSFRSLPEAFQMVGPLRTFPFQINNDLTVVGNIKRAARIFDDVLAAPLGTFGPGHRSEEHTSELQSRFD